MRGERRVGEVGACVVRRRFGDGVLRKSLAIGADRADIVLPIII